MKCAAPLALAYLGCLHLAGSTHPAAYTAACLGPVFGFLALGCTLAHITRPGSRRT